MADRRIFNPNFIPLLINARVSAALAAAGAWDATPVEFPVCGMSNMTLHRVYTRDAVGGAYDFQIFYSPYSVAGLVPAGGAEWVAMDLYEAGLIVAGADAASLDQRETITYTSQGAAAEAAVFGVIELRQTIERVRIRARESGAVGDPGTLQIQVTLG